MVYVKQSIWFISVVSLIVFLEELEADLSLFCYNGNVKVNKKIKIPNGMLIINYSVEID